MNKNSLLFKPVNLWYFVAAARATKTDYEHNFVQIGWGWFRGICLVRTQSKEHVRLLGCFVHPLEFRESKGKDTAPATRGPGLERQALVL